MMWQGFLILLSLGSSSLGMAQIGLDAGSVTAALESLDLADGEYRTAVYSGSGELLLRAVRTRQGAQRILDQTSPEVLKELNWRDRIRFMERALFEKRPAWSKLAAQVYGSSLPPLRSPNRGYASLVLGLSHLESDPDTLRIIDPETRLKRLKKGRTPGREKALTVLEAGAESIWLLQDEVIYRAYQVCLALGYEDKAVALAQRIQDMRSPRLGIVRNTLARAMLAEGDWQGAVEFLRVTPIEDETAELLDLRAQGYINLEEFDQAARVLEKLVGKYPKSHMAIGAYERRLDLSRHVALTPEHQVFLLARLQEGLGEATDSLLVLASTFSDRHKRYEVLFQVAEHAYDTKQYSLAESLLVSIVGIEGEWPSQAKARLTLARTYRNTGQLEPMREQYAVLLNTSSGRPDKALWELGREEYSQGLWQRAAAVFTKLLERNPTQTYKEGATMYRGFCRYRLGKTQEALDDFTRLGIMARTPEREEQAVYWQCRMLDSLGRTPESEALRRSAIVGEVPDSYYGVLLREESGFKPLAREAVSPPLDSRDSFGVLLDDLDFGPGAQVDFLRGIQYARLGLTAEASREFGRVRGRQKRVPLNVEQALALITATYHVYPLGITQAYRVLPRLAADAPERSAYERLALPPVFAAEVMGLASQEDIDPAVIWSIMRQESLYDPFAVSPAGALGLLQLMPETLVRITQEKGLESRPVDHLFLPRLNLTLGVQFYRDRLEEFGGATFPALASYNAGEDKVYEWLELAGGQSGADFIECIGYPETADYVRRIGRMMWLYPAYYQLPSER